MRIKAKIKQIKSSSDEELITFEVLVSQDERANASLFEATAHIRAPLIGMLNSEQACYLDITPAE